MTTIQTVKNDINEWRHIRRQLPLFEDLNKKYQKRISVLKNIHLDNSEREVKRLEGICSAFKLKDLHERDRLLYQKYQPYIDRLMPIDRIIFAFFIDNESYASIAKDIGFSEVGVRKRVEKAYNKISNMIIEEQKSGRSI